MGDLGGLRQLSVGPGWAAFADPEQYLQALLALVLATLSGLALAYHPVRRGRALSLMAVEQQKALVIYSCVGALIAIVCTVAPAMAFVIFGIGGLLRFRTDTGESKSTGHTIMGTLVGLCWGLGLPLPAAIATAYFWLMLWVLESGTVQELTVFGVEVANMPRAAEAYRGALARAGCRVLGQSKSFKKAQLSFVVKTPKSFGGDDIAKAAETIPSELRGTFDWPE